jgi:hypothetical protein
MGRGVALHEDGNSGASKVSVSSARGPVKGVVFLFHALETDFEIEGIREDLLSALHGSHFMATAHLSAGFQGRWRVMFPDIVQARLKPSSFGPLPILLRELVFVIMSLVNGALHKDCFPNAHLAFLPESIIILRCGG